MVFERMGLAYSLPFGLPSGIHPKYRVGYARKRSYDGDWVGLKIQVRMEPLDFQGLREPNADSR